MGIAATTFATARTAANFQAWAQEAPAAAATYLKTVAQRTGNVAALTQLDGMDANAAPDTLGAVFTQLGAAQLGAVQAARAEGLGWQANGPPKEAPSVTGKLSLENGALKLATASGTFRLLGGNVFGPGDVSSFVNRVVTVRGWPNGQMPADGTPPEALVISEFSPGASPDFVSGRLSVLNGEVYVQTGGEKKVHITDPAMKAALSKYDQLGVVLPGPITRAGEEWTFATTPKDYYVLAGFAVAGNPTVGADTVTFTLQMAHGKQVQCDMTRAAWDAAPHTSRHYVFGHFEENGRFTATGLTPTGSAATAANGGTPTESSAFVELATPVEEPKWTADEAKFGM